jgi:hypothetical protein
VNRLLTHKEVEQEFLEVLSRIEKILSREEYRGFVYDMQTSLGGFPTSKAERDKYIKGET